MFPKRLLALILFAALAAMPPCVLRAQWVSMKGPTSADIGNMVTRGDSVLACTQFGLYRSTDGGSFWMLDSSFVKFNASPLCFARLGNEVFLSGDRGIFCSSDFGTTWDTVAKLSEVLAGNITVLGPYLFGGTTEGVFHYDLSDSQALGSQWPIDYAAIYTIGTMGSKVFVSLNNDAETTGYDGIYRSTDSGITWDSGAVFHETVNSIVPFGNNLLAGGFGGVFLSKDSGLTWSVTSQVFDSTTVGILLASGSSIFVIVSDGTLMRSDDTGLTWISVDSGITASSVNSLAQSGNTIFAGTPAGVFISTNLGSSWVGSNNGFPISTLPVNALVADGSYIFAGSSGSGIYESAVNDSNWQVRSKGLGVNYIASLAANGPLLFAGMDAGIWVSSNGGLTWSESQGSDTDFGASGIFPFGSTILAGSYHEGVFRSTDDGEIWSETSGLDGETSYAFTKIGTLLFAATAIGGIAVSMDDGASWNIRNTNIFVNALASNGSILFAGYYRSLDSGFTWVRFDSTIFPGVVVALLVIQNNVFATGGGQSLYISSDNGMSWGVTGLPRQVFSIATDGTTIFAGTDSGVWRRPLSDFGISSVEQTPAAISPTIQIYPNPCTQSTQITFTSQSAGYAEVSIVNMLGVEVARVFSGEVGAGEHSFSWSNSTGLQDGVYECLVRMNGQVDDRSSTVETLPVVLMR